VTINGSPLDFSDVTGFDIVDNGVDGGPGYGIAFLTVAGTTGLYQIDLTSGAATAFGSNGSTVRGIAAGNIPHPPPAPPPPPPPVSPPPPPSTPASTPTQTSTVDGVTVGTGTQTNSDGTTSTVVTIPVVTNTRAEQVGNNTVADIPLINGALGAQVPTGIGLRAIGSSTAQTPGSALTDLIREIELRTNPGSAERNQLTGGGSGFLQSLPSNAPLFVQTIVPTAPAGSTAPGQPLVISGAPATTGSPVTALVIDARDLPSGTVLNLQNVGFAAVIGAVRVTGGEGSQNVWGDSADQYIVLGADDDTLHGGGGADYVGSRTGNDMLFGDDGADTVTGGEDADVVYGNQQDDAVYGNQGTDTLFGGQDRDQLFGGQDGDIAYGNTGEDVVYGNRGNDMLFGGRASDTLIGGQGDDMLFGGVGNDVLYGNLGSDTLTGGDGADLFVYSAGGGHDIVLDFDGAAGDRGMLIGVTVAEVGQTAAGDTLVTLSDGGTVTLKGKPVAGLSYDWFFSA
jgi:Ca2+-binding RTX toxin-like protein